MTSLSPPVARINAPTARDVATMAIVAWKLDLVLAINFKDLESDESKAFGRRLVMDLEGIRADLMRFGKGRLTG